MIEMNENIKVKKNRFQIFSITPCYFFKTNSFSNHFLTLCINFLTEKEEKKMGYYLRVGD